MSSLKKYEVVLEKLGAIVNSGQVINKNIIERVIEKEKINISQEEWKELLLFYKAFHPRIKGFNLSREERFLIIKSILYPDEVIRAKKEAKEEPQISPTPLEKAISLLKKREMAITNAHVILREVSEEFQLSSEERKELRSFSRKLLSCTSTKSSEIIDGDIERAFVEFKKLFMKDTSSANTKTLEIVAAKEGVSYDELKKLYLERKEALAKERRNTHFL